jgi:hypothetical protein
VLPGKRRLLNSVVSELIAVLSETKSKDTYLAAVMTLSRMGARAQPTVGAILRNGERLGVFEGAFGATVVPTLSGGGGGGFMDGSSSGRGASGGQGQIVLEALAAIVAQSGDDHRCHRE